MQNGLAASAFWPTAIARPGPWNPTANTQPMLMSSHWQMFFVPVSVLGPLWEQPGPARTTLGPYYYMYLGTSSMGELTGPLW